MVGTGSPGYIWKSWERGVVLGFSSMVNTGNGGCGPLPHEPKIKTFVH